MEFEREDLGAKPILIFLLALIIGCVLVAIVLKGLYSYLDAMRTGISRPKARWCSRPRQTRGRLSRATSRNFPSRAWKATKPRRSTISVMQEEQTLNSYGWVDQQAGVVRIPIDRAMALVGAARTSHPAASRRGLRHQM